MKILCEAGFVAGRKDGKWAHYWIDREGSERTATLLRRITALE